MVTACPAVTKYCFLSWHAEHTFDRKINHACISIRANVYIPNKTASPCLGLANEADLSYVKLLFSIHYIFDFLF